METDMNRAADNLIGKCDAVAAAALPALPLDLDLTLLSRRPARLPEQTVRAVMDAPIPVAPPACRQADGSQDMGETRASVVVVTCNNLVFTRMCLASLLLNRDGLAYEVI